eukprot:COSAG02_NODE_2263_length_9312_cov_3.608054_7_plen_76_part_00
MRCPAPAKPCHDCYNDTSAAADIKLALANGFAGVDTALGYVRTQAMVASFFDQSRKPDFVLTTLAELLRRGARKG